MSPKFMTQVRLLLSISFLLTIAGAGTVVSFFYETDAFVAFAYTAVAGFFFYAVLADANELGKYDPGTGIDREK